MAVTQNTYTGNGSTTNYSFTFPYLSESDVKVSLDDVDQPTTAYSFANATTINFNTAPGNGVAIRIYRQTAQDAPPATFFAGSAIRAQDLNENFLQQLYVAQETANIASDLTTGGIAPGSITSSLLADNSVTSSKIVNGTIVDADISASAEIAVSKLADGTARQLLQTDAAGTGVEWTSNVDVPGTLNVTGTATFDSTVTVPSLNGGPLAGTRNLIINGDMRIDQRNAGASVTLNNIGFYTVDRWLAAAAGGVGTGTATVQQVTDAPAGFTNSFKWTTTNAKTPVASDTFYVYQPIEGLNIDGIGFNTASAKPLTLSFWVKSSLTGTFSGFCRQYDGSNYRSYVFEYTISVANTWEYKTVSITADPSSGFTPQTNTGSGLAILFDLGSGSNVATTAGTWQNGSFFRTSGSVNVISTLNATWQVTGVQLEPGTVATPFERRSYGQELSLCHRYTEVATLALVSHVLTTNSSNYAHFFYRATKRAAPSYSILNGAWLGFTPAIDILGTNMARWTSGSGAFYSNQSVTVMFSAEL